MLENLLLAEKVNSILDSLKKARSRILNSVIFSDVDSETIPSRNDTKSRRVSMATPAGPHEKDGYHRTVESSYP